MAADMSGQAINTVQPSFDASDSSIMPASQHNAAAIPNGQVTPAISSTAGTNSQNSPSKDEVGWYFVEQYYTTLSRSPEKLHLFYAKRSQFVSGIEAEKVSVSVGQRAISERIKELDIQDCKVRVTNVDSQESGRDIVVQVIGEMSNKSAPHRKFVQTFILAEQPNGYYVLNDIFRYIADEEEEEVEEHMPQAEDVPAPVQEPEPHTLSSADDGAAQEKDAEVLDKKLEETAAHPEVEPAAVAAPANEEVPAAQPEPVNVEAEKPAEIEPEPESFEKAEAAAAEDSVLSETPKDPEPTIAPSPKSAEEPQVSAPTPADEPAAPPKPAAPKTWASMVAGPRAPAPAVPQIPAATVSPSQPNSNPQPTPAPVTTTAASAEDALTSPGGWQTAGQEHARKQARQQPGSVSAGPGDKGNASAYVKGVVEKVDAASLKAALNKYGKLNYFDVSRPRNCAFVEFADAAGYQAAVAANPHVINGVEISVEERRRNTPGYGGFNNRGGMRGGRGGLDGRTPSQGGRGNFGPRGRGGNMAQRGRGTAQAA